MPIVKCKICKKEFYAKPNWLKRGWGKFCSSKCQHEAQRKGEFVRCEICEKEIWRMPQKLKHSKSGKYFCCKAHQTLWRNRIFSGEKHWNWKNGENVKYKSILLKNKVKEVCKVCKCDDTRILAVHHLDNNHKNNSLENLVFLCHNCHHLVHFHKIKIPK